MAEQRSTRRQSSSSKSTSGSGRSTSRSSNGSSSSSSSRSSKSTSRSSNSRKLTGREAVEHAVSEAADLLGRPIESVLGLEPDDSKGWKVTLEVVELERIPRTTDVLGVYVVSVDKSGDLTGYHRERRYYRNQADEE